MLFRLVNRELGESETFSTHQGRYLSDRQVAMRIRLRLLIRARSGIIVCCDLGRKGKEKCSDGRGGRSHDLCMRTARAISSSTD